MLKQDSTERILAEENPAECIPEDAKKSFCHILKQGIYKEMYGRGLLTDAELNFLLNID